MLTQAALKIVGNSACLEFVGGSTGEVKRKVEDHIRENGKPEIVSGITKENPFRYIQRVYYRLGE